VHELLGNIGSGTEITGGLDGTPRLFVEAIKLGLGAQSKDGIFYLAKGTFPALCQRICREYRRVLQA